MPLSRASATEELGEDPRLVLLGDADPLVPDLDAHDVACGLAEHLDDAAFRRVLDRVLEQVREHLREPIAVAAHGQGCGAPARPRCRASASCRPSASTSPHDTGRRSTGAVLELDPARVDALAVEELVDQRGEPVALLLDDLEVPVACQPGRSRACGGGSCSRGCSTSGVRSSCDTMLISCDFSRSLWRSFSFCRSSSRCPLLERACHRVEGLRQRANLGGAALGEPGREVAGRDLARTLGNLTDRVGDSPCQEEAVKEQQPDRGAESSGRNGQSAVGLVPGRGCVGTGLRSLRREQPVEPRSDRA